MSGDNLEGQMSVDVLSEFIEVAIHCILYNRNLYPQGVFEKRVKYNVPVQICLHPDVCSYITNTVESLKILMSQGQVTKISVVVMHEETNMPVERFVLEIGEMRNKWREKDPHLFQIEQSFRGFLLKLNVSDALFQPPVKGTTWTVHAHTHDSTLAAVEEQLLLKDFPWTEAEEKQQLLENPKLVPLKSMTSDTLNMQLYVEESSKTS